ncbi:FAD-dependent oxidoreductase [Phytohabitans aurantiacus]|uniref:FAD dependent oxidoreductase domain-containing protein n=1 Tax=Phytohabitans aurantiacus TaxID=3016789 RepID=A0ABQ5RBN4_9ACTN|nr:FAD-dependent oxidoreductase [Phytohabitans aurantiacus]GLI03648.1 hypothetical protein Pa4123_89260 [Phytohabitans aurantiacus]
MPDERVDVLVVGSGLCGLTTAVTAARRGLRVLCLGDELPGASLANFGQYHSGAVYAPVLPAVARDCWQHRNRWGDLVQTARVGESTGLALFHATDTVDRYRHAWSEAGIEGVEEVDPRTVGHVTPPAAAFRIPDHSVNLAALRVRLVELAHATGVPTAREAVTLRRAADSTLVSAGWSIPQARVVVLATGAATPGILSRAGIQHTLHVRCIAWGRATGAGTKTLTYWLDGDLLAISPDLNGVRVGLPGLTGMYGTTATEHTRLRVALGQRGFDSLASSLELLWGTVCEPATPHADPSAAVIDLRDPPAGWSPAANLVVALPGKWTTAWHCADRVVDALM